jgi:hypothetical protein
MTRPTAGKGQQGRASYDDQEKDVYELQEVDSNIQIRP